MQTAADLLRIDATAEIGRIARKLREVLRRPLRRQGAVVGISGGIDSSVTAALAVKALGASRVLGLMMPERDSSPDSIRLSQKLADSLSIQTVAEDITPVLDSLGCYNRQVDAYRKCIPEYDSRWTAKIVISPLSEEASLRYFNLVAIGPDGIEVTRRLSSEAYLETVAATNFKQRVRKMLEYYHADLRNFAVVGTPNRLEYDQGFFVKLGDGAADVKPIAHLYKTQVFQLGAELRIPDEILSRTPTTDTYSMPQSQDEFFFSLPYQQMDVCMAGKNAGMSSEEVSQLLSLTQREVDRVFADIDQKRRTSAYLRASPILLGSIPEVV